MNWSKTAKIVMKRAAKAWADADIPYVAPKKTSVLPYVLGAFGVAVAGGITAVMVMSPRTRERALGAAKDGYGKLLGEVKEMNIFHLEKDSKLAQDDADVIPGSQPYANGLSGDHSATLDRS